MDDKEFGEATTNPFSVPCVRCRTPIDLKKEPSIDAIALCKNGHRNLIRAKKKDSDDWLLDK